MASPRSENPRPYTVTIRKSQAGRRLPSRMGLPELFLGPLNDYWIGSRRGSVATVSLPDAVVMGSGDEAWASLGRQIVRARLSLGHSYRLLVDGDFPLPTALDWTRRVAESVDPAAVTLHHTRSRHPMSQYDGALPPVENVTLTAMQPTRSGSWLAGIWPQLESSTFIGADLLLAVEPESDLDDEDLHRPLSVDDVLRKLERAVAWLIAGDGWGFFAGLPPAFPTAESVYALFERGL
jgi:hypothetical protein